MDFAHTISKNFFFFLYFLHEKSIYLAQKLRSNHFLQQKMQKFCKNQFFSNIFTFLSVIRQKFEDNLRILANFGKFSGEKSKIYGFRSYIFKKLQILDLYFLIKIILFTLKIY